MQKYKKGRLETLGTFWHSTFFAHEDTIQSESRSPNAVLRLRIYGWPLLHLLLQKLGKIRVGNDEVDVTPRPANGLMQRHNGTWDGQNQIPKSRAGGIEKEILQVHNGIVRLDRSKANINMERRLCSEGTKVRRT